MHGPDYGIDSGGSEHEADADAGDDYRDFPEELHTTFRTFEKGYRGVPVALMGAKSHRRQTLSRPVPRSERVRAPGGRCECSRQMGRSRTGTQRG